MCAPAWRGAAAAGRRADPRRGPAAPTLGGGAAAEWRAAGWRAAGWARGPGDGAVESGVSEPPYPGSGLDDVVREAGTCPASRLPAVRAGRSKSGAAKSGMRRGCSASVTRTDEGAYRTRRR